MSQLAGLVIPPDVLARARAGDGAALEAIYRAAFPSVRALVRRLVGRSAVADEITQDVFVQVLKGIGGYSGDGPFGAWIRRIAVTQSLMVLRSPWNRVGLWLQPAGDPEAAGQGMPAGVSIEEPVLRSRREEAALEHALARLTPLARTVVWLHDVEGYTHAEIARELGRSVSFSKSQLSRAHERLREWLGDADERVACTPARLSC